MKDKMSANEFRELIKHGVLGVTKGKIVVNELIPEFAQMVQGKLNKHNPNFIELFNLPKISLNKYYAGMHWSKRNSIKDKYHRLIPTLNDIKFPIRVHYVFIFKNNPLDASNCVGMLKMIEDVLFDKNDGYNKICIGGIVSKKGPEDKVEILIENIDKI
jgi:hypothetical protein